MAEKTLFYTTGMVFGVFDGLHAGHQYFLTEAAKRCKELIVVVAVSEIVHILKKHPPRYEYAKRVATLLAFNAKLIVVQSDEKLGAWDVLKKHPSEVVFLGHDQQTLARALANISMPFIVLGAYHPKKYKSSIIHGRSSE